MNKFDTAFTHKYGEHLTFPLLYVVGRPLSFCTGTDRCGSWLSRADWHWWHPGSRRDTPAALSPALSPTGNFSYIPFSSLAIISLGSSLRSHSSSPWTSSLPPSQWLALSSRDTTSCQWNDERVLFIFIHRRKMNNFFLLIPLYYWTSWQSQVGVLVSQHHVMNNRKSS